MDSRSSKNYVVQRSGLCGTVWQTVCRNPSREYAEIIMARQVRMSSIGIFRLLSPDGDVLDEKVARPLFNQN